MSSNINKNSLDINIKDNSSNKLCDKVKSNFLKSRNSLQKNNKTTDKYQSMHRCYSYVEDEEGKVIDCHVAEKISYLDGDTSILIKVIDPGITENDFVNEDDIILAFASESENNVKLVYKYLSIYLDSESIYDFMTNQASYSETLKIIDSFEMSDEEYEYYCKKYFPNCCFVKLTSIFDIDNFKELK